jgi:hypothetical protein
LINKTGPIALHLPWNTGEWRVAGTRVERQKSSQAAACRLYGMSARTAFIGGIRLSSDKSIHKIFYREITGGLRWS